MNLEEQLRATAEGWFSKQPLSPQGVAQLESLVQAASRRRRFARIGAGAAAAAVLALGLNWPMVISAASEVPLVGSFISRMANRDRGAMWANEKGFVVPVDKAVTKDGYTFRVESLAADAARTLVYFTVDGPDLTIDSAPRDIAASYNRSPAPIHGYGAINFEIVDGRMVGRVDLAPLPHPTALVGISASQIAGLEGEWKVSFMASRTELDRLTRTVEVGEHLRGDGYDLIVHRILLAPTETWVEMTGTAAESFDLGGIELLADGKVVASHGGSWSGSGSTAKETRPMTFTLPFDRVEGEPETLTLRLSRLKHWIPGGPAIDVTKPGSTVQHDGVTFTLESVSTTEGKTTVALAIPGDDDARTRAWSDFGDWVLVDAAGHEYERTSGRSASESSPMQFTFEGVVNSPLRLEARRHTVPATGATEITIPLR